MTTAIHLRCAAWAKEVDLDPAGTAPRADVFVLVELPLPWPSDVGAHPLLEAVEQAARIAAGAGRTVRVQAVAVEPDRAALRRVVVFNSGEPPFSGYGRAEGVGAVQDVPSLVATLIAAGPTATSSPVTDVLICTHGSRDTCCGSVGTKLWLEVADSMPSVRVWRTSHTGGHRFAPTAITFPDGNYWAHLDGDTLRQIVTRTISARKAAPHLRGCASFDPPVQVADRAVFAERGWGWFDCARFGEARGAARIDLCFEAPDGERGGYDVLLEEGRLMPVPDCGGDPEAASKHQAELRAVRIRSWS